MYLKKSGSLSQPDQLLNSHSSDGPGLQYRKTQSPPGCGKEHISTAGEGTRPPAFLRGSARELTVEDGFYYGHMSQGSSDAELSIFDTENSFKEKKVILLTFSSSAKMGYRPTPT